MLTKDQLAMEVLRALADEGFQVRLSNKISDGYWWAYCNDNVAQANDPAGAILDLICRVQAPTDFAWDDACERVRKFLQGVYLCG